MSSFTERLMIDAPIDEIWAVLDDIGAIADWNPGLLASRRTNDVIGVGGTRLCELPGGNSLTEEVVERHEPEAITFRITDSTLPFRTADIAFTLRGGGGGSSATVVTVAPTYVLRYGLVGRLLDLLAVRRSYRRGMRALLRGLEQRVSATPTGSG